MVIYDWSHQNETNKTKLELAKHKQTKLRTEIPETDPESKPSHRREGSDNTRRQ